MAEFDNKFRIAIQKLVYIYTFKKNGRHQNSSWTKNQCFTSAIFELPLVATRGQIWFFGWQIWIPRTQIRYTWQGTTNFYLVWTALRLHVLYFLMVTPFLTNVIIKKNLQFWSLCSEISHGICQHDL